MTQEDGKIGGYYKKHIAICPKCKAIVRAKHLSYQQWEVAKRLIGGEATAKIARDLFVSIKTVEAHRHRILEILEIKNIAKLIRWANDQGLLALMGWDETKGGSGEIPGDSES